MSRALAIPPALLALQSPAVRAALAPGAPGAPPKRARRATGRTVPVGASPAAAERCGGAIIVTIPGLRLVNGLNAREHWSARKRRASMERALVAAVLGTTRPPALPVVVTITRIGGRPMDEGDGLPASCKHLRDAVATWLGTGDAPSARVEWRYRQERGPWGVRITIERSEGT